jgi:hypothetical protein
VADGSAAAVGRCDATARGRTGGVVLQLRKGAPPLNIPASTKET